jgi:hypothetical protein
MDLRVCCEEVVQENPGTVFNDDSKLSTNVQATVCANFTKHAFKKIF